MKSLIFLFKLNNHLVATQNTCAGLLMSSLPSPPHFFPCFLRCKPCKNYKSTKGVNMRVPG